MKTCSKCKVEKDYAEFSKHQRKKDGYRSSCKKCDQAYTQSRKAQTKLVRAEYYKKHKTQFKDRGLAWRKANAEYIQQQSQEYYQTNKSKILKRTQLYRSTHRPLYAAATAKYRSKRLQATPHWLTEADHKEIAKKYKYAKYLTDLTGESWHVDHIHPLQGKNICGLHVPSNLQVIPGSENQSKSNKHKG